MTGKEIDFFNVDLCDYEALKACLNGFMTADGRSMIDGVIHFAGLKAVGESWQDPLLYYQNNIVASVNILRAMRECGEIKKIIFSSSATVYGEVPPELITENSPVAPISPYGRTKAYIESIIQDTVKATPGMQAVILRYFNPVGADISGMIGEDPADIPNNLMPFVAQVAVGKLKQLRVFGSDYDTIDGTGVRDYIHVTDLAIGHIAALKKLDTWNAQVEAENNQNNLNSSAGESSQASGTLIVNLGTGRGTSVLEIVNTFTRVNNIAVPYEIVGRRPGDAAFVVANPAKANQELNWTAQLGVERMCQDLWRWQSMNPQGYRKA